MLWIGICEAVSVACIGGVVGGCLMAFAQRQSNKFNMEAMETYWNSDIQRLQSIIEIHSQKLSTLSVAKPVSNPIKHNKNKGYNHTRHFNQRG